VSFELRVEGIGQQRASLAKIIARFPKQARAALQRQAERIMTDSKEHYVPVDNSPLKNSGHVSMQTGNRLVAELSFGGAAGAYALAVHEHPSSFSPPSWQGKTINWTTPGTGAKYLEKPLMRAVPTLARDIATDLNLEGMLR
jgi:hypothetical protein